MVQINKLKGLFMENGMSCKDVAKAIGISESTMARRMRTGTFHLNEADKIKELFKLSCDRAVEIFFPDFSSIRKSEQ